MKISIGADGFLLLFGVLLAENRAAGIICIICATIHELGHIFAAAVMKIRLRELKIGFAGARIYPQNEVLPYKKEFFLCAAGPFVNLTFAFLGVFAFNVFFLNNGAVFEDRLIQVFDVLRGNSGDFEIMLLLFVIVSFMQALVNLLPIEGLDGGRMMVSVISQYSNAQTAYRAERAITFCTVTVMWLLSIYLLLKTSSGIGILLCAASTFVKMIKTDGN